MPLANDIVRSTTNPAEDNARQHGVSGSFLGKYYTRITIGKYQRPKPFESPQFTNTMVVFLPIPNELRDDTSISYTNMNLETVGDFINGNVGSGIGAALLRKSGDIITGAAGIAGNALAAAAGAATRSDAVESAVGGAVNAVGSLFPAEQITSAIQQSFGKAPNPNPSVAFQGPVLRDFSYTWAFYPKNKQESIAIDRLIKELKKRALPRNWANKSAAILDYPDMCQINFYPWDNGGVAPWFWSDNSIIRYKKCVMQGVNVNYNPFGTPAFFEDSTLPVSYQLTISFREIEYMLSHDWESVALGQTGSGTVEDTAAATTAPIVTSGEAAVNAFKSGKEEATGALTNITSWTL